MISVSKDSKDILSCERLVPPFGLDTVLLLRGAGRNTPGCMGRKPHVSCVMVLSQRHELYPLRKKGIANGQPYSIIHLDSLEMR